MSQGDQDIANQNGAAFRSDLNAELKALVSNSAGVTTPVTRYAYQFWADTTFGLLKQRNAANTAWLVRSTLVESMVVARTSNVILTESDRGRWFVWNGTFTQTIDALSTLDEGWHVYYRNDGGGVITVDPSGAELIDGGATLALAAGDSGIIFRDATSFKTIRGLTQSAVAITGGTITGITDLAVADGGTGASTVEAARANLNVPAANGAGAHAGSGPWPINITGNAATAGTAGHASTADSANMANVATTANNGGVTSVNGGTGGLSIVAGATTTDEDGSRIIVSIGGGGAVTTIALNLDPVTGDPGNSSIHPDSEIAMADGGTKWLRDVRVGDMVRGRNGPAEVLGIWTNILQERSLWEVATADGAVACTPGHLFPVKIGGKEGWGAPVPQMYWDNSHGRKRTVKGKRGLIDTTCCIVGDDADVETMAVGTLILNAAGAWVPVTKLREVHIKNPGYDKKAKRSLASRVNEHQQVIALYLEGSNIFYADGYAVATLA